MGVWEGFSRRFLALWDAQAAAPGDAFPAALFGDGAPAGAAARRAAQQAFMQQLWQDSVGFGGAVILRRLVGIAHVADFDSIADPDVRAACERRAFQFGRRLLVDPAAVPGPRELVVLADSLRADGRQPYFPL